jgi:hypothetical protein
VQTASLGDGENFESTVTAGSRLKGLSEYLRDMLKAGRKMEDPSDENATITEIVSASDTITFTAVGAVTAADVAATDTITFTGLGGVVEGPNGPFTYGSAQYGFSAYE